VHRELAEHLLRVKAQERHRFMPVPLARRERRDEPPRYLS
jgi:hypothetical protein